MTPPRDPRAAGSAAIKRAGPAASLALLVDSVRDYAIIMLDPEGHVASWNRGAEQIKGYTADEIIGEHFSRFYPEGASAGTWERELETARDTGRFEEEAWRRRKDGTLFWAWVVLTAMRDEQGRLVGYAKVTRDLTERRHAEEALRRSEERFRLLVESVKDYAIFILDPNGHVATWNAGAERIKGYRAEEIIGQHFSRFYPEDELSAGKIEREIAGAIADGRFEDEGWRLRKDGSRFWANVVLTALRDPHGNLVGFAKVTRDLTDRRRLEDERVKLAQAEEAVRLRDEFLSIASHELKTPLSSLLLQLESLSSRFAGDEAASKKLERAARATERMTQLVDSLLDVSRLATGRFELVPAEFDLGEAVHDVVERMRDAAAASGCPLAMASPAGPITGRWDRLRIEQVVTNLLSNAMKYAAGTPIEVSVAEDGDEVLVRVRDHGPGIKPSEVERVFGRFERGVSMRHYGGLGLGLYLVEQIARAHGGGTDACDAPGGGALLTVRLPRALPHRPVLTLVEDA